MSDAALEVVSKKAGLLSRKPYLAWGVLALIQIGLISLPLTDRLQVQLTGDEVTLELIPVDPRDLLRGDYVIVSLAIAQLSADLPGGGDLAAGETVYVELKPEAAGIAKPVKIGKTRDLMGPLVIAGTVKSATAEQIIVDYGIDAFFLPEGEGRKIERLERHKVRLVVAVADDGRSLPLNLLVDGKPFKSDAAF